MSFKRADTTRCASLFKLKKEASNFGRENYLVTVTEDFDMILRHNGELDENTISRSECGCGGGQHRSGGCERGRHRIIFAQTGRCRGNDSSSHEGRISDVYLRLLVPG